ncbi:MAG: copper-binding protein [Xanthobacteraceae bacterium]|nr:copper-binding protein [Xanthobacteraceae bacterium]MBV9628752.1 copper-binding protein [Xanthobacteraceae bacterium]
MRKIGLVLAGLVLLATPVQVVAQSPLVDGQVTKVDVAAGKITIKHGPFKKFDMDDPMTMIYPVQDPAMLKTVTPGDKIKFDADSVNGQITVTKIQKTK